MSKVFLYSYIIILLVCWLWSCSIVSGEMKACNDTEVDSLHFIDSAGYFGYSMLNQISHNLKKKNLVMSPFSVATGMAMVAVGATGMTKQEIAEALPLTKNYKSNFRMILHNLKTGVDYGNSSYLKTGVDYGYSSYSGEEKPAFTYSIANGIFVNKLVDFSEEYKDMVECFFQGKVANMEDHAADQINSFVSEATEGHIKKIVTETSLRETKLVVVSAVHFKGEWTEPFKSTKGYKFQTSFRAEGIEMPFMEKESMMHFIEKQDEMIVRVPYKGDRVALYIVLPKENCAEDLSDVELNRSNMDFSKMKKTLVKLVLPRFSIGTTMRLKTPLKKKGIVMLFDKSKASLLGISKNPLYVSQVYHRAYIKIDEKGTEAGAASAIIVNKYRAKRKRPKLFVANRPFMFVMKDDATGVILFDGIFRKPA